MDRGYAGTTTQEVGRRAGVSRGTLLHHFPTRTRMVVWALDHVLAERLAEFRRAADALPAGGARAGQLARLLWTTLRGPTFYAWLELAVASRTDDELRSEMRQLMVDWEARVQELYRSLVPRGDLDPAVYDLLMPVIFGALNNLAIDAIYRDPDEIDAIFEGIVGLVETVEARLPLGLPLDAPTPPEPPSTGDPS